MSFYRTRKFNGKLLDPYEVLKVYEITHPAIQHAIKKLLRLGRTHKNAGKDVKEAIQCLKRWEEMEGAASK